MRSLLLYLLIAGLSSLQPTVLHAASLAVMQEVDRPGAAPKVPSVFSVVTDRIPITDLSGFWRFQPGDNPSFALPGFDDSHWPLLRNDESWASQGYRGLSGYGWYRFRVVLPRGKESMSMILPPLNTSYQCFVDGQLRSSIGAFPPPDFLIPRAFNNIVLLSSESRPEAETVTVALRVWHTPLVARYRGGGPLDNAPSLARAGSTEELRSLLANYTTSFRQRNTDHLFVGGIDLLAAFAATTLFLLRRRDTEYIWFGLALFLQSLHAALSYSMVGRTFNSTVTDFLSLILEISASLAFLAFYKRLLGGRQGWFLRIVIFLLLLELLALSFSYLGLSTFAGDNLCDALFGLPLQAWVLLLLIRRAREGMVDARLLLFPVALSFLTASGLRLATSFRQFNHPLPFDLRKPFLQTPFQFGPADLSATIFFLAILAILINRFARTSREVDRTLSELGAARTLQKILIPEAVPSIATLALSMAYHPAHEVGGDFFQILPIPDGDTVVVLGDVSGKGLAAAMTVSVLIGAIRTIIETTGSPPMILASLNRRLLGQGSGFTTCLALRLSPTGLLTLANAGQLAPYLNGFEISTPPTLPLGLSADAEFSQVFLQLNAGDRLTLLTDGVPEAQHHKELFGFERTEAISMEPAATIAEVALSFGQTDDITVLSIVFTGAVDRERTANVKQG